MPHEPLGKVDGHAGKCESPPETMPEAVEAEGLAACVNLRDARTLEVIVERFVMNLRENTGGRLGIRPHFPQFPQLVYDDGQQGHRVVTLALAAATPDRQRASVEVDIFPAYRVHPAGLGPPQARPRDKDVERRTWPAAAVALGFIGTGECYQLV
jgi:hypothetical protein